MALRVELPADREPVTWVWGEAVPRIGVPAAKFSAAVYEHSTLSLREFEAARIRIAQVNHCCSASTGAPSATASGSTSRSTPRWPTGASATALSERERLAAEYAERFAADHLSLDDDEDFWTAMKAAYTDEEIIELSMCIGSWIAFGRLNHVLGIDAACQLPAH